MTQLAFGAAHRDMYDRVDLPSKFTVSCEREARERRNQQRRQVSASLHIGSHSLHHDSLAETLAESRFQPIEEMEADGVVIGPLHTVSERNSMTIKAKLRPLLNSERIEQSENLMKKMEKQRNET